MSLSAWLSQALSSVTLMLDTGNHGQMSGNTALQLGLVSPLDSGCMCGSSRPRNNAVSGGRITIEECAQPLEAGDEAMDSPRAFCRDKTPAPLDV